MDRLEVSFAANVRLMIKFPVIGPGQDQLRGGGWSLCGGTVLYSGL